MRVPLSWLRAYAPLPEPVDTIDVARRLTAAGLEVEALESVGHDIRGVVIAQVLSVEELTGLKKPIRYCRVAVTEGQLAGPPDEASGVICGAVNFAAGDRVPLALPGAVLPGGFEIGARRTYGRMSEGMICSARELAIGEDHAGIIVLPPDAPLGADFVAYAGLRDEVFEIAVTPDRGYAVSVRGIARELAGAYGVPFTDPADPAAAGNGDDAGDDVGPEVYPARIGDPAGCDRIVLREVRGFSPAAPSPLWMRVRLARCDVRSISLAVDVTNYLMLELGQPLHAFDRSKLTGEIVVRRAQPGEKLETLDHVVRTLDSADLLITDASGPISMAGTMGGLSTEIDSDSGDLVIEAAHFDADVVAKMSRRHKLHSEASYRFERGVDRELPLRASAKAVALLSGLGGGRVVPGRTHASAEVPPVVITMAVDYPDRVAGVVYGRDIVVQRLREVGCAVRETRVAASPTIAPWRADSEAKPATSQTPVTSQTPPTPGAAAVAALEVTPPSWRPDLTDPADLAEEVIRLEGYENVPARMPRALAGRGLTPRQRLRRSVGRTLAESGYVEVLASPFGSRSDADLLGLPPQDPRRTTVAVANPLSEDEPLLRTTLLPGLLRMLGRNIGRGFANTALFEIGPVFRPRPGAAPSAPILPVDRGPSVSDLASLEAALPDQPVRLGAVLAGARELDGWRGPEVAASWADAIEAAREVGRICRVTLDVRADQHEPWHPGRCAAIYVRAAADGESEPPREWLAGHAGELHPRVVKDFGLPDRTCALELDLSVLFAAAESDGPVQAPRLSSYPLATQDVALIVDRAVPAAQVGAALVAGAGRELLEDVRLFDVYTGAQVGADRKSLAYTLRFRAPDRTLTVAETTAARDAAVAEAGRRVGAVQRG